ncbi:MAG: HAD family phosphatase [Candidatus Kerfeldbacteria bacterium]|nr:HAD family phosphatase [Candidatus Kerfeldbacteria bacterium]
MSDFLPAQLRQPFQAVLFDFDGTIVDSEAQHFAAFKAAMREFGYDYDVLEQHNIRLQGNFKKIFQEVARVLKLDPEIFNDIYQRKVELTLQLSSNDFDLVDGVVSYIEWLVDQHIPLGIVTNAEPQYIDHVLQLHQLTDYFSEVITSQDADLKPAPAGYVLGAERLAISPDHILVFENTDTGITAAKAAGMKVVAIRDTDVQGLSTYEQADHVIDSFADPSVMDVQYHHYD